jgi:dipeptidyl-peptidase-4
MTDNVHISQSMLLMKALSRSGVIYKSQVYPDENHGLHGVLRHLYQTMEDFLSDCFSLDVVYDEVGLRRSRIQRP